MSYVSLTDKTVTCKKQHTCIGCGETIPKGDKARYTAGIYEGDFQSHYWCEICEGFIDSIPDFWYNKDNEFEECCIPDEEGYKEFKQNYLNNKNTKS